MEHDILNTEAFFTSPRIKPQRQKLKKKINKNQIDRYFLHLLIKKKQTTTNRCE